MAVDKFNVRAYASGGNVGGKVFKIFHLATNDAASVVEADGYLDSVSEKFTEGAGDIIHASMDLDGTPVAKSYLVTRNAGDIALTRFVTTAG